MQQERTGLALPPGLTFARVRLTLVTEALLELPSYKGNALRAVLGMSLLQLVCARRGSGGCPPCGVGPGCPYGYLFEPKATSGTQADDVPGAFVLRPPLDSRMLYRPGEELRFELVLIGRGVAYLPFILLAFQEHGPVGLGRRRAAYRLAAAHELEPYGGGERLLYSAADGEAGAVGGAGVGAALARAGALPPDRLTVRFETAARLKHQGRLVGDPGGGPAPELHIVVGALLRRVAALSAIHGGAIWRPDAAAFYAAARAVRLERNELRWAARSRYSARQGQWTPLDGVVGAASYGGDVAPLLPLLALGEALHIGKGTAFGLGRYSLQPADQ